MDIIFWIDSYFQPFENFLGLWPPWFLMRNLYSDCCYSVCHQSLFYGCFPDKMSCFIATGNALTGFFFGYIVFETLWIFRIIFGTFSGINLKNICFKHCLPPLTGNSLSQRILDLFILSHRSLSLRFVSKHLSVDPLDFLFIIFLLFFKFYSSWFISRASASTSWSLVTIIKAIES